MKEKKVRQKRKPTLLEALIPIIAMLAILFYGKGLKGWATEPLLIVVAAIAALVAVRVGCTWDEMLNEISNKIAKGMPAILILISVGALIGTWKASGTIPMMIYYGIQIVNPKFLLVTAFLICALVSIVTGTSWGSVGTMGVALMGIASGLNVSLPATAGAVIAGSYFGDKLSPLSDTTNLAPIAAGSELYSHIKHMLWTTIPATVVSLLVYAIVGSGTGVAAVPNPETVETMLTTLDTMYSWNILLLLPAVIILAGSVLKLPTIPVMLGSSAVAGVMAFAFQHISLANILASTVGGFDVSMVSAEGFDPSAVIWEVTRLINGGGMTSIMSTTLLVFCAFCFAGIMSCAGCLDVVLENLLSVVKSTGGLIASTVVACLTMALTTGNSYLSILIPGEMFRDAYKKRGLAAVNLSRTLEDAGTVVVPIVPWSAAGAYMTATLGVETLDYLPWAVLCYIGFLFAILYGFTGIGIKKLTPEEMAKED
ncbi:Na+/H+ antiporter NhaC [Oscillibacter hominis]|uniref:Na+/H+ antiporter NhaC n=1 Tax=Oscillibacter hominis TaxID=2763056 RepID=A0A7G9B338_9FIRM|nr:Na+/H+ antiporter NhaC [Oscillibacter hominis]QNL43969.1 Na+/H+ antiporter NhaC [Oscillibacter hominis]